MDGIARVRNIDGHFASAPVRLFTILRAYHQYDDWISFKNSPILGNY